MDTDKSSLEKLLDEIETLRAALAECVTDENASGWQEGLGRQRRRLKAINDIAQKALAETGGNQK